MSDLDYVIMDIWDKDPTAEYSAKEIRSKIATLYGRKIHDSEFSKSKKWLKDHGIPIYYDDRNRVYKLVQDHETANYIREKISRDAKSEYHSYIMAIQDEKSLKRAILTIMDLSRSLNLDPYKILDEIEQERVDI